MYVNNDINLKRKNLLTAKTYLYVSKTLVDTVCPGSSDPPEKIYLHQKMRFTPFLNYFDILSWNIISLQSKII